jgi:methyl-accepting chemotaxis protein-1 (serine sensor receptor)
MRREEAGLTQEQLSFEADVRRTYVSLLELGRSAPTLTVLFRIAALCALGLHKAISGPLTNALRVCSAISKGDLTHPIAAGGRDEMGNLIRALSAMRDGLSGTVSSVRDGSATMATATQETAAGNADLSRRTESQAAALQQTAASMEQLTATVRQNNANASHASQLAKEASEIAASGGGVMGRVVGTMADIHEQSEKMSTAAALSLDEQAKALQLAVSRFRL